MTIYDTYIVKLTNECGSSQGAVTESVCPPRANSFPARKERLRVAVCHVCRKTTRQNDAELSNSYSTSDDERSRTRRWFFDSSILEEHPPLFSRLIKNGVST